MQQCFGYIRVSTKRQADKGVSLSEQREAIERYAAANDITITMWFKETLTASKEGRPEFDKILKLLRDGKAEGVVIHKIDRSARNLHDWADLSALSDEGIAVHIAHETLDLKTRGGRLAADIQAVVASDYSRNLRQEARKGFYGNLKRGLYPLCAPMGYLNKGKGAVKAVDPERGPLIAEAFKLYATGRYSLHTLAREMAGRGLTTRAGRRVSVDRLSKTLANPFYTGLIKIKTTGETFLGIHEPLITTALFERVREVAECRLQKRPIRHDHLFRRLLTCGGCGTTLIGERQKGRVYYRCHTKDCLVTSAREDAVHKAIRSALAPLALSESLRRELRSAVDSLLEDTSQIEKRRAAALTLERDALSKQIDRLVEAYLDGTLAKEVFTVQHERLQLRRSGVAESLARSKGTIAQALERARHYIELAFTASLSYEVASKDKRRRYVETCTSNRVVDRNGVSVELSEPFQTLMNVEGLSECAQPRDVPRTSAIVSGLCTDNIPRWCLPIIGAFLSACKSVDPS